MSTERARCSTTHTCTILVMAESIDRMIVTSAHEPFSFESDLREARTFVSIFRTTSVCYFACAIRVQRIGNSYGKGATLSATLIDIDAIVRAIKRHLLNACISWDISAQ